ncbi:MAG: hypothetical protein DYH20_06335 [Gammaproteobacteria bacterium PRO9]|nr:hypothetical protein [Gammaproteobacteria bacterium PRO9]
MTTAALPTARLGRLSAPPFVGIFAFIAVLGIVPLMHSVLDFITDIFPDRFGTPIGLLLGAVAVVMVIRASLSKSEAVGTWTGFISAHLIWSGWIELGFRFNPDFVGMSPLIVNGEAILTPSLMFVEATTGLLMATLPFFVFNRDTRCNAFMWIQRMCRYDAGKPSSASERNFARITFLEVLYVIWFCYAVSLFLIDTRFFGLHHPATYVAVFLLAIWTFYLLMRLIRFTRILQAVRYAIPTAGVMWVTIEITQEWGWFTEFWTEPLEYLPHMGFLVGAFVVALGIAVVMPKRRTTG